MIRRPARLAALLGACSLASVVLAGEPGRPDYPATKRGDVVDTMHGEKIADPYRWLETDDAPEVVAWDREQDALTRSLLDAVPGRALMKARIDAELDLPEPKSLPTFDGGRLWYTQKAAGSNHEVLFARDRDGAGDAKSILDPNAWSEKGTEKLNGWFPSPDGRWLAYLRSGQGSEQSKLYLRDLEVGSPGTELEFAL